MPETTTKLKLQKPLGNEAVSLAKYNENLQLLDDNAAAQTQVNEPFYLKSAVYNETGPSIDLTFGPGRMSFSDCFVTNTKDSTYSITFPAINTNYWIFIQKDGTYTHNTTGSEIDGAVRIWIIETGSTASQFIVIDRRGQLPGAGANEAYNVTTKINGKTISSIFESNGITVKNATLASSIPTNAFTSHFGFLSGTINHGGVIPLPSGFTQAQCKWIVSTCSSGGGSVDVFHCSADANRNVSCYVVQSYGAGTAYGVANYLIIGVK
jgi:hypothetical protein